MQLSFDPVSSFQAYLLGCFAVGLLLSAKCLVQMAFPRLRISKWVELLAPLSALCLACVLGLDALGNGGVLTALPPTFLALLSVVLGLVFVAAHWGVSRLQGSQRQLALQPVAWVAVVLTLAASTWSSHRYESAKLRMEAERLSGFSAGDLEAVLRIAAVTDRGREIELYRWGQDDSSDLSLLTRGPEDSQANCHGWVFMGGQYLLKSDGVERVLEDNGYQPCQSPQAGDLIIYRNAAGEILHTGLVKAAFLLGSPMIESKWGQGGRFVHSPEEQPYGSHYTYYRSARQGHAIPTLPARPTMSIASR